MVDNSTNTAWSDILDPEKARKASREVDRVLREEFAQIGVGLRAALKVSLNVEAALREALNSSALQNICRDAGAAMAKGLAQGLGSGGGALSPGGKPGMAALAQAALDIAPKAIGSLVETKTGLTLERQARMSQMPMEVFQAWVGVAKANSLEYPEDRLAVFFEQLSVEQAKARKNPSHELAKRNIPLNNPQEAALALADTFRKLQMDEVRALVTTLGLDIRVVSMLRRKSSKDLAASLKRKRRYGGYNENHAQVMGDYQEAADDFFQSLVPILAGMQAAVQSWLTPKVRQGTEAVMLGREGKPLTGAATGLALLPGQLGAIGRELRACIALAEYFTEGAGKQRLRTGLGNISAAVTRTAGNAARQKAEGLEQLSSGARDGLTSALGAVGDLLMWLVKFTNMDRRGMDGKARDLWTSLSGLGGAALDVGEGMLKMHNPIPWAAPDASPVGSGEEARRLAEMHAAGALEQRLGVVAPWIPEELLQNMLHTVVASVQMAAAGADAFGPPPQPSVSSETTVNVGEVTVNTQATDVWAISRDLSAALADTIPRNIVDAADSGVAR